jgi:hypothetical protein
MSQHRGSLDQQSALCEVPKENVVVTDMERKRAFVAEMYPSAGWKKKVSKMPDGQIFAIYMREQHKLENHHDHHPPAEPEEESDSDGEIPF